MCFRPHRADQNDGLMDFALYAQAIDECARHGLYSIRLSWRGEPTLHPRLIEMVRYARGIREVSFLTNWLKIEGAYAEELVRSGIDYISISIDGLHEDYNRIRKPATFEETVQRIKGLRVLRDTIGGGLPLLKVNTVWSQVRQYAREYYETFSPYVDIISFNPDYDYSEITTDIQATHICQYPYQRLTVKWNGDVPMCISDWDAEVILGNLRTENLHAIWHGPRLDEIRRMHRAYKIKDLTPCRKCHRPVTEQVGNKRGNEIRK